MERKNSFDDKDVDDIEDGSSSSSGSGATNKSKKQKLSNELQEPKQNGASVSDFTLVDFPDEVLYEIFKHLDTWTILELMSSAPRFVNLLLDKRFWYVIDLSENPLKVDTLETVLLRSHEGTHTIKVCGTPSCRHFLWESRLFSITLKKIFPKLRTTLQVLELESVTLNFTILNVTDFPTSLKKLTLKNCNAKMPDLVDSVFDDIETHLKDLDELAIEYCDWFRSRYFPNISQLPILRKLSLKGCKHLTNLARYSNMAVYFGFQTLEILDLRFTPIKNVDLERLNAIESLRQLLLDCPPENNWRRSVQHDDFSTICRNLVNSVQVNDSAMFSFGRVTTLPLAVIFRIENNRLERLILRNYEHITDLTLKHLVHVSPNLVYIDVSGTRITREGVHAFQSRMPECNVIATHFTETDANESMAEP